MHISEILGDLLQLGQPQIVFSDQPSFHKLLTHIFMLEVHTSKYLALHDLINITKSADNIFACKNKDKNKSS